MMIEGRGICIQQGQFRLDNLSFEIKEGEYVGMMGTTGCGKTTLLECICGLRPIQVGQLFIDNREVTQLKPAERAIGYVPQDGALFANMSVAENIGFGLKLRKWSRSERHERVEELASLLGIPHLLNRKIEGLSGGEKQRVALGRALSFYPKVLCMDEPLSALDEATKNNIHDLLLRVKQELNITVIHVSHSRLELETLSDKVLFLNEGVLEMNKL